MVELDSLAACWLAMAAATTLPEIEAAALAGLLGLIDVEIAYLARRERGIWTIGTEVGLEGDVAGVNIAGCCGALMNIDAQRQTLERTKRVSLAA